LLKLTSKLRKSHALFIGMLIGNVRPDIVSCMHMMIWSVLSSLVQVLDTKWVFDLKSNTRIFMMKRFKTLMVADGQPQNLGFDCQDMHAATIPMPEINFFVGICAHHDMELLQMDSTTIFISAALNVESQAW
jgi:hypothetical protein